MTDTQVTFDLYSEESSKDCEYPDKGGFLGLMFCALKLNGEAGEVAEKVGKCWRDNNGILTQDIREAIAAEIGDTLWYLNRCAEEIGIPLIDIACDNILKVQSRRLRKKVEGSGDNR